MLRAYPDVDARYLVMPSEDLPGNALNFNNAPTTWPSQMIGRKDGKAAIEAGKGSLFKRILNQ